MKFTLSLVTIKSPSRMSKPHLLPSYTLLVLILTLLLQTHVGLCNGVSISHRKRSEEELQTMVKRGCGRKVNECEDKQMLLDSETNRRALLLHRRYISYATLLRDLVPCDRPGASYYNCRSPAVANSYNRGCEIITRCARGD